MTKHNTSVLFVRTLPLGLGPSEYVCGPCEERRQLSSRRPATAKMVNKTIVLALALLLVAAVATFLGVFYGIGMREHDSVGMRAVVAADAGPCSVVGRDILRKGGTAVDSAIAALLCVGLMNAHSMGIGGGLFLTIYDAKTGKVETINARETAPSAATENMYGSSEDLSRRGGLSIAVPGEIRGYELAHQRHGKLPWKELFQPSIQLAEEGFRLGKPLADAISKNKNTIEIDKALCEVFCGSNGEILKEGDIIKFTKLAQTYRKIAEEGPNAFYEGELAKRLVDDIQKKGGIITEQDLKDYTPLLDENPLRVQVGDFSMVFPTAPASGPVLALILNILNGYKLSPESMMGLENQVLTYHRIVEAFRFGYAKRTLLGDLTYLNITDFVENMTSAAYANELHSKITDDTTHPMEYYGPQFSVPDNHGTSHLSVVAADGSAVAATSTINHYFGSKVMSNSTGILLNNEMDDFSSPNITNGFGVPPSPNNFIKPGKRPMSSMCPTIIFDKNNNLKMVVGGSGGTKITTSIAMVILKALFFGYGVERAVMSPRIHNQLSPTETVVEPDFDKAIATGLEAKNHTVNYLTTTGAVVQAVVSYQDGLRAQSDPRKSGYASGY